MSNDVQAPHDSRLTTHDSVLDGLAALVDHSLVMPGNPDDDAPRYRLLETVREFAHEQLVAAGEEAETRARHAQCYLTLAETAAPELYGPEQLCWLDRLERDDDNLRAAQGWTLANGQWDLGLRLAIALHVFWLTRAHAREERAWLEQILAITPATAVDAQGRLAARGVNILGALDHLTGDYQGARNRWEESLARRRALGDLPGQVVTLNNLAMLAADTGDFAQACDRFLEAIRLCRQGDDRARLAHILHNSTVPLFALDRIDQVWEVLQEVRDLLRDGSDPSLYAYCLNSLAHAAWRRGDAKTAGQLFDEALPLCRRTGNERAVAAVLRNMSIMALAAHQPRRAAAYLVEALTLRQARDDRRLVADLFDTQAAVAVAGGQAEAGARLLGAADALREETGARPPPDDLAERERTIAATIAALGKRPAANNRAIGRGLPFERAIAEAIAAVEPLLESDAAEPLRVLSLPSSMPMHDIVLTRRERDVLKLLIEGRSDREIAAALFLSHRTVSRHVSHILAKLDVPTRSAAATYAVRCGLI